MFSPLIMVLAEVVIRNEVQTRESVVVMKGKTGQSSRRGYLTQCHTLIMPLLP